MDSFWSDISAALVPGVLTLFGTVMTLIISRLANMAEESWGIDIEARHRAALHSAIMSGVRSALARGLDGNAAVSAALAHASASVPDAIRKLPQATPEVLTSLAEAKLRETLEGIGRG